MSWSSIIGHAAQIGRLRAAIAAGRLHPALLFEGPEGVGKRLVALTLARALHCPHAASRGGDPCGECRVCLAIDASGDPALTSDNQSASPAVRVVTPSRPDERELAVGGTTSRGEVRAQIAVPQIRVVLSEGLSRDFARGPRVIVMDPADRMTESAASAMLKTLEEPPSGHQYVLVSARASALLPTILSRCCRFRFGLLSDVEVRAALGRDRAGSRDAGARSAGRLQTAKGGPDLALVASLAGGRVGRALALAQGPALAAYLETRDLFLAAIEGIPRGIPAGTFAVVAGASFRGRDREDWLEAVGVLEVLLRDLAVLAVDPGALVANVDVRPRLEALSPALGPRAARALALLDSVRSDLRFNVNGRLAAERLLVEVAR